MNERMNELKDLVYPTLVEKLETVSILVVVSRLKEGSLLPRGAKHWREAEESLDLHSTMALINLTLQPFWSNRFDHQTRPLMPRLAPITVPYRTSA